MTDNSILWQALQAYIPRKTWIPLSDILATVRSRVTLDKEDLERKDLPPGPPRWESNLRRLLRAKTLSGNVRARRRNAGKS
jgi:hypothetical protein